ncbi:MAG TPA: TIGR03617 family F420-dependent LLM class oxidoreductase [Myxococcota bacterium]|jgi:probable F420-dependent oxidoreductase
MEVRPPLAEAAAHARRAERLGYQGLSVPEAVHDGMLVALLCLEHTRELRVATGALVAFARSPMLVAQGAWDLQRLSGGRFELGLGSQVRGNLEGRFGVAWTPPAPRMRDYVRALRAVFARWQDGTPLAFESEHYRLTRMQPYFDPGPLEHAAPPIWLGAVNPGMLRAAGEVGDGALLHPTNSDPRTLREVARPALAAGAARAGRSADAVAIHACPLIATGRTADELAASRENIRETLAFLYSTPAYWPALVAHGWGEVGERLHGLSRAGAWGEMRGLLTDEMLAALVPQGLYPEIADILLEWYGGLAGRIAFPLPADPAHDAEIAKVVTRLRSGSMIPRS